MSYKSSKLPRSYCLTTILSMGLWSCFASTESTDTTSGGATGLGGESGGAALGGSGGSTDIGSGGTTDVTPNTGGTVATGGTTATGGTVETGGTMETGGFQDTGGTTETATGGRSMGGRTGAGGSPAGGATAGQGGGAETGGMSETGGSTNATGGRSTGGRGGGATGGAPTGGVSSTGGVTSNTGGTDTGGTTGGTGECVKGQTKGKEVAVIGESFIDMSSITSELEKNATAAGSLAAGEHYDDNAVSGTTLANDQIPSQYRQAVKDQGTIKYVFMDGGGNDCLINNNGDAALGAAESLFKTMADDGTEKVVYFFYPDPVGANFANLKTCLDSLRPKMKAICDGLTAPKCYWLDLRDTWNGHNEYTSDGIHPTAAGSKATADAIWEVAEANCVAQ